VRGASICGSAAGYGIKQSEVRERGVAQRAVNDFMIT